MLRAWGHLNKRLSSYPPFFSLSLSLSIYLFSVDSFVEILLFGCELARRYVDANGNGIHTQKIDQGDGLVAMGVDRKPACIFHSTNRINTYHHFEGLLHSQLFGCHICPYFLSSSFVGVVLCSLFLNQCRRHILSLIALYEWMSALEWGRHCYWRFENFTVNYCAVPSNAISTLSFDTQPLKL